MISGDGHDSPAREHNAHREHRMEYDELMKALGGMLGLEEFRPDANGIYCVSVDDTIVTFIEMPQAGLMETVAKLCEIPDDGGERLYRILLTAMAPGGNDNECSFFIDSNDKCLYLRHTDALAALDGDSAYRMLEKFANAINEWRGAIGDFSNALPAIEEALEQQAEENRKFGENSEGFLRV